MLALFTFHLHLHLHLQLQLQLQLHLLPPLLRLLVGSFQPTKRLCSHSFGVAETVFFPGPSTVALDLALSRLIMGYTNSICLLSSCCLSHETSFLPPAGEKRHRSRRTEMDYEVGARNDGHARCIGNHAHNAQPQKTPTQHLLLQWRGLRDGIRGLCRWRWWLVVAGIVMPRWWPPQTTYNIGDPTGNSTLG